jgi:hypothetical protein
VYIVYIAYITYIAYIAYIVYIAYIAYMVSVCVSGASRGPEPRRRRRGPALRQVRRVP